MQEYDNRGIDPATEFERRDAEEAAYLKTFPVCTRCENPIQDEAYFEDEDGTFCEDCWKNHQVWNKYRRENTALLGE